MIYIRIRASYLKKKINKDCQLYFWKQTNEIYKQINNGLFLGRVGDKGITCEGKKKQYLFFFPLFFCGGL
jgi:hypothetical protein